MAASCTWGEKGEFLPTVYLVLPPKAGTPIAAFEEGVLLAPKRELTLTPPLHHASRLLLRWGHPEPSPNKLFSAPVVAIFFLATIHFPPLRIPKYSFNFFPFHNPSGKKHQHSNFFLTELTKEQMANRKSQAAERNNI